MNIQGWLPAGITLASVDAPPGWERAYLVVKDGAVEGLIALRYRARPHGRTRRAEWQGWATGVLAPLPASTGRGWAVSLVLHPPRPPEPRPPAHDQVCDDIAGAAAGLGMAAGAYLALSHIAKQVDIMQRRRLAHEPQAIWRDLELIAKWCTIALTPADHASAAEAAPEGQTIAFGGGPRAAMHAVREDGSPHRRARTG